MKKKKIAILVVFIVFSTPFLISGQETEVEEYFKISLLSPNNNAARNQFSLLIQDQLPKIGIGIDIHESTTWGNIKPRTWMYPLIIYDYIPTYAQGGYDGLFLGYSWDLDWYPDGLYTTGCMSSQQNYYQYVNPSFDAKMTQYLNEQDGPTRRNYLQELAAMLHDDLPAICIVYPRSLFAVSSGLTGFDGLLLYLSKFRAEYWDDLVDHIIKHAIPEMMIETNTFAKTSFFKNRWMAAVYGSLFKRGQEHHNWEPVIAADYDLSSDGKNHTIYLDTNAKFSDGSPVLAEDVKYTYELHMTPLVKSSKYRYLSTHLASNNSIEIVNSHTLNFNLSSSFAFSMNLLSLGIIDKSDVEPTISSYGYSIFDEEPLTGNVQDVLVKSCGPFMLENYTSNGVKLIPNSYWSDLNASDGFQPHLNELSFVYYDEKDKAISALFSGEIDIFDPDFGIFPPASFDQFAISRVLIHSLSHQELGLNMKHPVFGTGELTPVGTPEAAKAVRKAISHAIPRDQIVDEIYEGVASPGASIIHNIFLGLFEGLEPYAYDLDLAVEYMEDAGFTECGLGCTPYTPYTTGYTLSLILLSVMGLSCCLIIRKIRDLSKG